MVLLNKCESGRSGSSSSPCIGAEEECLLCQHSQLECLLRQNEAAVFGSPPHKGHSYNHRYNHAWRVDDHTPWNAIHH